MNYKYTIFKIIKLYIYSCIYILLLTAAVVQCGVVTLGNRAEHLRQTMHGIPLILHFNLKQNTFAPPTNSYYSIDLEKTN